ncbi:MAG: ABC transporter permease, partial [Noviherbaspirillum sp.]
MMPQSAPRSISPGRRVWLRFRKDRRGYWSLVIFLVLFGISLMGELISNDKPLVARYNGELVFPLFNTYSEKRFGGDFESPADYLDPFIQEQFQRDGNWAIYPLNHY